MNAVVKWLRCVHEGSKKTSLAWIRMKHTIAKRFDSYAAVIISGLYRKAGEMLAEIHQDAQEKGADQKGVKVTEGDDRCESK